MSDTGKPPTPEHSPCRGASSPTPRPPEAKVYTHASGNWPAVVGDVRRVADWTNLKLLAVLIAGVVSVLAWGQSKLDAGVAPVKELVAIERAERKEAVDALRAEVVQRVSEVRSDVRDMRLELRAMQRGERLAPLPPLDGGAP